MSMDADASLSGKRGHTSFHGKNTSIFRITKKFKLFVEQLEKAMVVLSAAWAIFLPHSPSRCPLHTLPWVQRLAVGAECCHVSAQGSQFGCLPVNQLGKCHLG